MTRPTPEKARIVGTHPVHIDHGNYGDPSRAVLHIDRRLKSGNIDVIELTENDLLRLIESAASALRILRSRADA